MPNLSIAHTEIRQLDGLYSLNALHKASGHAEKHQPNRFFRTKQTQELIAEIQLPPNMGNGAVKRVQGGIPSNQGTYVCKELVYAYAMWISPKFNLMVIRAFDALQTDLPTTNAPQLQTLQTQNSQLKAQLSQQNEMLELYRFKACALEQQAQPKPKRKAPTALTDNEINAIHTLHGQGLSNAAIAKQIGRSGAAVSYIIRGAKAGAA